MYSQQSKAHGVCSINTVLGNRDFYYFGFTLIPEAVKPGHKKLKLTQEAKPPTDIKTIT